MKPFGLIQDSPHLDGSVLSCSGSSTLYLCLSFAPNPAENSQDSSNALNGSLQTWNWTEICVIHQWHRDQNLQKKSQCFPVTCTTLNISYWNWHTFCGLPFPACLYSCYHWSIMLVLCCAFGALFHSDFSGKRAAFASPQIQLICQSHCTLDQNKKTCDSYSRKKGKEHATSQHIIITIIIARLEGTLNFFAMATTATKLFNSGDV